MMFLILFLLQASPLLDLPVKQVVEIIPITENKILIAHNTEPDVVSILNTASGEIIQTVIRKGKGPSEAIQIDAMGMDNKTGMVYVCADYTKIMVLSKDFKLVKERPLQLFGNSISFSNDFIFIGLKSHLTDYKQNVFPACIVIEKKSLSIVDTLFLNTSNFELDKVNQISQIQNIPVYSNVTFLTNSLFVSVNGFPYLFKYETVKKTSIPKITKLPDFEFNFKVVNKKGIGVGLQIPSVCISSSKVSDNEFIISFGNVYQEMPYGFYKVSFDKVKGNQSITKNVIADFPEKNSSYNISSGNNGIYIFDSLHSFANNVFFMRLK